MVKLNNLKFKNWFLPIMLALMSFGISAQDIHYSQFNHAPLLMNPALTGLFDGEHRIMANYRAQWNTVPVGYKTFSGVYDTKAFQAEDGKSFFGLGGIFNFDEAGDSHLSTVELGVAASYSHQILKSSWLTAGVQLKGSQRRFQTQELRTDNQWDAGEDVYDPTRGLGENFDNTSIVYGDISAGVNWRYKKPTSRTTFDLGVAMHHINQPKKAFFSGDDQELPNRKTWYGLISAQATSTWDVVFNISGNYQGPYVAHVMGLGGRLHLSQKKTKELSMLFGMNYRFNDGFGSDDALFPTIVVEYQSWRVGLSYDMDISSFNNSTNGTSGNGGPELSMRYLFKNVGKPDFCPTCPTYL